MIGEETWRIIPPEEKLGILAAAQGRGVLWALSSVIIGATFAISFQVPAVLWTSILVSPLIFQFAANRRWRTLRPKAILEYLAARSVTRRYAFAIKSEQLEHILIFRGKLRHESEQMSELDSDDIPSGRTDIDVWIALFPDCVVVISEQRGGAILEFGHLFNSRFSADSIAADGKEYSSQLQVFLEYNDRKYGKHSVCLTSQHVAALNIFEKKMKELIARGASTSMEDTETNSDSSFFQDDAAYDTFN